MTARLYSDLALEWYPLLDPREDHADEGELYASVLGDDVRTVLELGSGAGNGASFLTPRYAMTLCDLSPAMLEISRGQNPAAEHVVGDMRSLRLSRVFDAVLVHDALSYLTTRADLRAALETAFAHLRPGGTAIFAPDGFREDFYEFSTLHEAETEGRALRCIEWFWDPDPGDDTCVADYVLAMRDRGNTRVVHDRHEIGLYPKQVWLDLIRATGFGVRTIARCNHGLEGPYTNEVFVCRRPA